MERMDLIKKTKIYYCEIHGIYENEKCKCEKCIEIFFRGICYCD